MRRGPSLVVWANPEARPFGSAIDQFLMGSTNLPRSRLVLPRGAQLPEMPNTHDAYAHPAGAYRIRTSHVRLLQMRSRRTSRDTFRSDGIRCGWLVHWRTTAAQVTGTLVSALGVGLDPRGNLRANTAHHQTSRPNVFSAGDMRRGPSLVVRQIREGPSAPAPST